MVVIEHLFSDARLMAVIEPGPVLANLVVFEHLFSDARLVEGAPADERLASVHANVVAIALIYREMAAPVDPPVDGDTPMLSWIDRDITRSLDPDAPDPIRDNLTALGLIGERSGAKREWT